MPKTLYIFDLENVPLSTVKEKIESMGNGYDYLLFFGYNQRIRHLPTVSSIEILQADGTGENYLDFQLVSELTTKANSGAYSNIIVVSNDKGFDAVINHLSRYTNVAVSRQNGETFLKAKIKKIIDEGSASFTKKFVQDNFKFLIKDNPSGVQKRLYNFALHTPTNGCIRTPKQWKELIRIEFAPMNPEKVYNALKKGGLIEKHNSSKNRLNLTKAEETVAILRTLK